ncbi:OBERON-like protein [Nymphaea thermarum]|nr:OBERON-like protein [Nymphaea thermarum]
MGTSSGASFQPQMPPPRLASGLQTSLSLASSEAGFGDPPEPASNSDPGQGSATESASSRETWSAHNSRGEATGGGGAELSSGGKRVAEKEREGVEEESNYRAAEQAVVRRVASSDRISLRDVAKERVEVVAERMQAMPEELLEEYRGELRSILEGTGGPQQREEFLFLQKLVQGRLDLTAKSLVRAHRAQLEILVAINTGIQAFLHPTVSLPQSFLIEIFTYKRCRNIACQNALPADDCSCEICTTRNGFCNVCMCVICSKFDFEVNTCRWVGCDSCSHWTHTDCAIRGGQITMGPSRKAGAASSEMVFRCQACNRTSELLGWVKDVFQQCAPRWDREALIRELDAVSRIFRGSEDSKGRKLFWKCEELLDRLKNGVAESAVCKVMLLFFEEIEMEGAKNPEAEESGRLISPQEACNRIAEVVQEAVKKMEMVAEEKKRAYKKSRVALEACDRELEEKSREVAELQMERQRKKQQIEELETIIRLKQAEADMFQIKATEARREAERLKRIMLAKSEKAEEEYASSYLQQRLNEAEAEKRCLFEKIRLQESSRLSGGGESSQMLMLCKIQDMLKNVYNVPPTKVEGQSTASGDHQTMGSVP